MDAVNDDEIEDHSTDSDDPEEVTPLNRRYHQLAWFDPIIENTPASAADTAAAIDAAEVNCYYQARMNERIRWTNSITARSIEMIRENCLRDDFILLAKTLGVPQRCIAIIGYADDDMDQSISKRVHASSIIRIESGQSVTI